MSDFIEKMEVLSSDELEVIGCKTFACPSLTLIDEKGKELGLTDSTIKRAKDMAIEYLKKTYHRPRYSSFMHLLPSFVHIASMLDKEQIFKSRILDAFGISGATMTKWDKDIIGTLNIKISDSRDNKDNNYPLVLISNDDVVENISRKGGSKVYSHYDIAFRHNLPSLLEMIKSNDEIVVSISDIAKELGDDFENKSVVDIYMGMRHILFEYGVYVVQCTIKDIDPMTNKHRKGLKMRMFREGDPLPSSIKRLK